MISITVQCPCGQRYAFDTEPLNGQVTSPVVCPTCGADGTAAANAAIAQSAPDQPSAVGGGVRLRVAAPARPDQRGTLRAAGGLPSAPVDRTQAQYEAIARISWGEPPAEVVKYLRVQGFSAEEASELVEELFRQRAAEIRGKGILKIIGGICLAFVPIITWIAFLIEGYIYPWLFAGAVIIGFYGVWLVFKGIRMVLRPRSEAGDVMEQ